MLGIARLAAETTSGDSGSSGLSVIVFALYGGIFVFALISWIAWGFRQRRGGVIEWGDEPPAEGFGHRIARMGRTASAPPAPSVETSPLPFFDDEAAEEVDDRERHAG